MTSGEDLTPSIRAIERYGGFEAVGSTLWLEHVEGIRYRDNDGTEILIKSEDLAADQTAHPRPNRLRMLQRSLVEELSITDKKDWLRSIALHILPLRIAGNPELPPVLFDAEFRIFKTPKDLARSPTVVDDASGKGLKSFAELFGIEVDEDVDETDEETRPSTQPADFSITMSLRLVPQRGEVSEIGYYPASDGIHYGMYAMEMDDELIKMQLHHRIYVELYRNPPTTPLEPLIAPHQF